MEQLDLPESVTPILEEQQLKTGLATPEPEERVRPEPLPQNSLSQVGVQGDLIMLNIPSMNMTHRRSLAIEIAQSSVVDIITVPPRPF